MFKKIRNKILQGVKLLLTVLLFVSSNQTTSFAGSYSQNYKQSLNLSDTHSVEISTQPRESSKSSGHYSLKIYSMGKPKLISATRRELSGSITDVLIEDINDDMHPDIVVMMEDYSRGRQYLVIDTFSFDGKNILWKQQLPKGFISVKTGSYLKRHQIPNGMTRNTATALLDQ